MDYVSLRQIDSSFDTWKRLLLLGPSAILRHRMRKEFKRSKVKAWKKRTHEQKLNLVFEWGNQLIKCRRKNFDPKSLHF